MTTIAEQLAAALDNIGGLSRALRVGGPDPMDLQELSDALSQAVDIAHNALAAHHQSTTPAQAPAQDDPEDDPPACEASDWVPPAGYDGDGSVAGMAARAAPPTAQPAQAAEPVADWAVTAYRMADALRSHLETRPAPQPSEPAATGRAPISDTRLLNGWLDIGEYGEEAFRAFKSGVRFAEKCHGIAPTGSAAPTGEAEDDRDDWREPNPEGYHPLA